MMKKYNVNQTTLKILGLYRSNYATAFHVREVARKIRIDVKAVQLQLRMIENVNVVSGTTNGRNKEYRLNLGNYLAKYYMLLAEVFASISFLSENFEVKKLISEIGEPMGGCIVLFGSFAKGEMTQGSDIDLLFIGDGKPDANAAVGAGRLIGREVNVKSTTEKKFSDGLMNGDPLIREVIANHIILKDIDTICNVMWLYYAKR
jgi:predicted nucleotidyltransferase